MESLNRQSRLNDDEIEVLSKQTCSARNLMPTQFSTIDTVISTTLNFQMITDKLKNNQTPLFY
jgi:hypothetical protein